MTTQLRYVFVGLSITSSWGNGHATTYRALLKSLAERGHSVTFLERDLPYYADNRDMPSPPYAGVHLYRSLDELRDTFSGLVRAADFTIVGSYVPDGVAVGDWLLDLAPGRTAFYDIDTPVTLAGLTTGRCSYLSHEQVARHALYLSFTGGPTLSVLEDELGSPCARPLYCSVDSELYYQESYNSEYDLGYLGTYSADRQPALERLLLAPAARWPEGRFVVAGPQYDEAASTIRWPSNVERVIHLPPREHRRFYNTQRWTLNVTRRAMAAAGWSPSVRLFEAGACGTAILSDPWPGLEAFLTPGREILVADDTGAALRILRELPDDRRAAIGAAARRRVLAEHTSTHRAETLERYTREVLERQARRSRKAVAQVLRVLRGANGVAR